MNNMKNLGLPNILTVSRIIVVPVIIGAFYLPPPYSNWVTFFIFLYAGLTDYLDGKIARHQNKTSEFGQILDPIADKLIVTAIIVMLIHSKIIDDYLAIAAIIILLREILVSGLREFLSSKNKKLPVSKLAKLKTVSQFIALLFLLLNQELHPFPAPLIGEILLWLATLLTIITGYNYIKLTFGYLEINSKK